jgi:flagellar basal body-associated protein FliL
MDSFNKREILIILAIILFAAALAAWATMYVKNRYYAPRVQTSAQAQEL